MPVPSVSKHAFSFGRLSPLNLGQGSLQNKGALYCCLSFHVSPGILNGLCLRRALLLAYAPKLVSPSAASWGLWWLGGLPCEKPWLCLSQGFSKAHRGVRLHGSVAFNARWPSSTHQRATNRGALRSRKRHMKNLQTLQLVCFLAFSPLPVAA